MNKQEAIEKIRNISTLKINDRVSHHQIDMVIKNQVLDIISQINELDKVVVPKFVAEYIEYCKHDKFYALHGAYAIMDDRLKCWRFKGNNSELFAKAWLYGYEVEKEKLYTVEIAGVSSSKIFKNIRTNKYLFHSGKGLKGYTDRLTEKEIKQADERLWQFAKEVEE
jgi:hypothetical protein